MTGVYFPPEAYAGIWRRLAVAAVDGSVAVMLYAALAVPLALALPDDDLLQRQLILAVGIAVWLGYFVLLKWTRWRTVGYRLGAVRLVNLQGERAGLVAVALRSSFMILGPLNYLFDLAWLSGDPQRQALRDKFAHTYVVRQDAEPVGSAPVAHVTYHLGGATWNFPEIRVPPANPPNQPAARARG